MRAELNNNAALNLSVPAGAKGTNLAPEAAPLSFKEEASRIMADLLLRVEAGFQGHKEYLKELRRKSETALTEALKEKFGNPDAVSLSGEELLQRLVTERRFGMLKDPAAFRAGLLASCPRLGEVYEKRAEALQAFNAAKAECANKKTAAEAAARDAENQAETKTVLLQSIRELLSSPEKISRLLVSEEPPPGTGEVVNRALNEARALCLRPDVWEWLGFGDKEKRLAAAFTARLKFAAGVIENEKQEKSAFKARCLKELGELKAPELTSGALRAIQCLKDVPDTDNFNGALKELHETFQALNELKNAHVEVLGTLNDFRSFIEDKSTQLSRARENFQKNGADVFLLQNAKDSSERSLAEHSQRFGRCRNAAEIEAVRKQIAESQSSAQSKAGKLEEERGKMGWATSELAHALAEAACAELLRNRGPLVLAAQNKISDAQVELTLLPHATEGALADLCRKLEHEVEIRMSQCHRLILELITLRHPFLFPALRGS